MHETLLKAVPPPMKYAENLQKKLYREEAEDLKKFEAWQK